MKKTVNISIEREFTKLISNIVYSQVPTYFNNTNKLLKLSLMLPGNDNISKPLIIWIVGGGWKMMDKDFWIPELVYFTRHGYAVASIEYRVSSEAIFPAQIEDVKSAIRYMRANAKKYGIDPQRIGIMGESAGGHLAALAGTAGNIREFDKGEWLEQSSSVQAVVDLYGPTDFIRMSKFPSASNHDDPASPESILVGGPIQQERDKVQKANPVTYISEATPPFLILHGDNDQLVPFNQSEILYEALESAGVEVTLYNVAGAGHASEEFRQPEIKKNILDFFDTCLKNR